MHKYIGVMFLYGYCLFNRTMHTYIYIHLYSHIDKLITVEKQAGQKSRKWKRENANTLKTTGNTFPMLYRHTCTEKLK